LLEAIADAPGVNCVLAGDGPMRSELERRAAELGIAERVAFLGAVDSRSVASLYAGADLLVLPSVSEASPLVVVEAMASGVPVLATRVAGVPTFVDDFRTGFLVRPGDRGELGVALRFLMRDTALRERMSERARQTAHERHPWSAVARRYEQLYRSVLPAPVEPLAPTDPVHDLALAA
ncbi:MAG TPA: glycosyltransferase, partial [Solirubrobacteraceae bacterium]